MAVIYIDNLHKQLYVSARNRDSVTSTGDRHTLAIGLSDFGELPGQSTWFIRSIRFYCSGYQDSAQVAPDTLLLLQAGIVARDLLPGAFDNLEAYQDVNGWPLNKVQKSIMVENIPQQNWFSYQHTYTPRKNLTLNREQDICWNLKNESGNDVATLMGMYIHAERGD